MVALADLLPPEVVAARHPEQIGRLSRRGHLIVIREDVLDQILDFSALDLQRETGGFLLGRLYDAAHPTVEICAFLPATSAMGSAGHLKFTHETWAAANDAVESKYPDLRIVGWHHTHPGLGIFLSSLDLFIHRNFFSQRWDVALVVDPRQGEFGFYQWQDNQIASAGFLVLCEETRPRRQFDVK